MDPEKGCCQVITMCGYSLHDGVLIVGTATILISIITLTYAVECVKASAPDEKGFNGRPEAAVEKIFGLYSMSISVYQIIISFLLIWQVLRKKRSIIFFCTLWHVSHVSIMCLCFVLCIAQTSTYFVAKKYFKAVAAAVAGLLYQGVFIYFSAVVNSFSNGIDDVIYY